MEKQEWFEYFEAVNGRKPTLEEFSKAKASGFFEKKKASEKEEKPTHPQQETPLSPKQVRENWVKDFELNHGRKPSFEEFFEGVEALKQPAPQPTTNPVHQTVSTQPINTGLNQQNFGFGHQVNQSNAINQSQSDVNSNPQMNPFSSGPISPSQDTPQWSGTSQSNSYFTRPSSPYSQTNYTNTGQTAPLNTYAMTDSFWSNITTKHKSLLALMLIANLFFVFYGLKPAEGTNANGYIYESGSVFYLKNTVLIIMALAVSTWLENSINRSIRMLLMSAIKIYCQWGFLFLLWELLPLYCMRIKTFKPEFM